MIVTKAGDQLTVYNANAKRTLLWSSFLQAALFVAGWAFSINLWVGYHNRYGTSAALWSDPVFLRHVRDITAQYLGMALLFIPTSWIMFFVYQDSGKVSFSRLTKTVQIGRRIIPFRCIKVSRQPSIRRQKLFVSLVSGRPTNSFLSNQVAQFSFRQPENAERVAEEIAGFSRRPVQWPEGMS